LTDTRRLVDSKLRFYFRTTIVLHNTFYSIGNVHLTQSSLCRMTRTSHMQAVEEASLPRVQSGSQASGSNVGETFPITIPITNPPERAPTSLTQRDLSRLCYQLGIREADALLPTNDQRADIAPAGFVTVNRQMCSHGAIPPFSDFLASFLRQLSIAPSQLHPNGYAILLGLCVLFSRTLNRLPTSEEIFFLCYFSKGKDHPSIMNVRGARYKGLILDLPETAHGFLTQYFYVNCPAGFYSIWREGGETAFLYSFHIKFA